MDIMIIGLQATRLMTDILTSAVVDCGSLGNPGNGEVSVSSGTTYNSTATYSCNAGYTLTGDDVTTCQTSGVWSGSEPTCTGKDTSAILLLRDMILNIAQRVPLHLSLPQGDTST